LRTELYWIEGPWTGRLAIAPRPRGDDWLEDEIAGWKTAGVDVVISLLTSDEVIDLSLGRERSICEDAGIAFVSLPIVDRSVPPSMSVFLEFLLQINDQLSRGDNVAIHCRQGIGRAALAAICLLVVAGIDQDVAIARVNKARGCGVPETNEQSSWIREFVAMTVAGQAS